MNIKMIKVITITKKKIDIDMIITIQRKTKTKIFFNNKISELGDKRSQWGFDIDTSIINPFTEDLDQRGCDLGLEDNGRIVSRGCAMRS